MPYAKTRQKVKVGLFFIQNRSLRSQTDSLRCSIEPIPVPHNMVPETAALALTALCLFWPDIQLGGKTIPVYVTDLTGNPPWIYVLLSHK